MTDTSVTGLFTLAGVIVGGVVTYFVTRKLNRDAEESERKKLAEALLVELEANMSRLQSYRKDLEQLQPGTPLNTILDRWSGHNFFPVFDGNAHRLALFGAEDAASIVRATMQFKVITEHVNMLHDRELLHAQLGVPEAQREELRKKDADELRPAFQKLAEFTKNAVGRLQKYR